MKHPLAICVAVLASMLAGRLAADQIDYSLNLLYADPADDQSGGTWELVARADEEGLVIATVRLTGLESPEFQTPLGEVMGTTVGFEENQVLDLGTHMQMVMSQIPQDINLTQPLFYDVGVLGGGTMPGDGGTPSFAFDAGTTRSIPWGISDSLGDASWDGAVLLASGMFAAGTTPEFFDNGTDRSRGAVFGTLGDPTTPGSIVEATVSTTVRNNLMAMMGIDGDYNNSGQVEQADLDLVLLNWGTDGTTPPMGWVNDLPMGQIDQEELDGVLLNWGNMAAGALVGAQGVPEPSTLGLLLTVAITLGVMRRRVGW